MGLGGLTVATALVGGGFAVAALADETPATSDPRAISTAPAGVDGDTPAATSGLGRQLTGTAAPNGNTAGAIPAEPSAAGQARPGAPAPAGTDPATGRAVPGHPAPGYPAPGASTPVGSGPVTGGKGGPAVPGGGPSGGDQGGQAPSHQPNTDPTSTDPASITSWVTETRDIPYSTQVLHDPEVPPGEQQVRTPGRVGTQTLRYAVTTVDGRETGRTLVETTVIREPVTEVVAVHQVCGPDYGGCGPDTGPCTESGAPSDGPSILDRAVRLLGVEAFTRDGCPG